MVISVNREKRTTAEKDFDIEIIFSKHKSLLNNERRKK